MLEQGRRTGLLLAVALVLIASGRAAAVAALAGDCDGSGVVTIDELVRGVNIGLDEIPLDACPAFDVDGDGAISIGELILAVNRALNGAMEPSLAVRGVIEGFYGPPYDFDRPRVCSASSPTPPERLRLRSEARSLHRDHWRKPYPSSSSSTSASWRGSAARSACASLRDLPGQHFDPGAGDTARWRGSSTACSTSASGFCLLFDDLREPASTALDPELQVGALHGARRGARVELPAPDADLWFIGNVYTGLAADLLVADRVASSRRPVPEPPQVYYHPPTRRLVPSRRADHVDRSRRLLGTPHPPPTPEDFRDFASGRPRS